MSLLNFIDPENNDKDKESSDKEKSNRLLFSEVTTLFEQLQTTRSTLEKEGMIAKFLQHKKNQIVNIDFLFFYQISAKDFVNLEFDKETGVSIAIFLQAVSRHMKIDIDEINLRYKGDWGKTIMKYFSKNTAKKKSESLTVSQIVHSILNLTSYSGSGSQKRKQNEIISILKNCTPFEAKYFTRLILGGSLKTGAKDKLIQRAFLSAFSDLNQYYKQIEYANKTRRLNFGQAIFWYLENHIDKITELIMKPGHPVSLMLAERGDVEVVTSAPHFMEYKYDGFRLQAHYDGKKVTLFSRGLENHTDNLADVAVAFRKSVKESCIVDGEILAYNKETGDVLPFQSIIRRKRKYDRNEVAKTMHTEYRIFDLLFYKGKDITSLPLIERRGILEEIVTPSSIIQFSEKYETQDPEEALALIYKAKKEGHEGGILKNAQSPYLIGVRDKSWTKIKPQTYDMDAVLIGGQYGTGKRANMISRVFVSFPVDNSEDYESLGVAIGSGMSEEIMIQLRQLLESEGVSECPFNVRIANNLALQVNTWIYPEKGPVLEIVADSFSWKTKENIPLNEKNIPKTSDNDRYDLTKVSLRFPRCKGIRESGKKANSVQEVSNMIRSQLETLNKI
ncbi:MAG: DNA ligase [Candidatus Heimdallarchaeota archaeon LC_3]|nr:MAG: DNA ligase [Candidatus Heimdallarchaeota archaeon LC_3]